MCQSPDGRTRKGDVIVYWNKGLNYFDSGASITQTWRNFTFTNSDLYRVTIGVTGSRTLTNIGKDSLGDHSWKFTANLTLTYSTGGKATWNSTRNNILQKVGSIWYYVITGSASGMCKSGVAYNLTITRPLYWTAYWLNGGGWWSGSKFCDCFEAGPVELTRTSKTYPLYLTFTSGVGNCGHTATATINGNNYNIAMP